MEDDLSHVANVEDAEDQAELPVVIQRTEDATVIRVASSSQKVSFLGLILIYFNL